ncbi:hypothetical protein [Streptomyces sp. WMMC897]|nr:hypothetical protein [Streptomyces sp. WMMC897]MCZ7416776.1 hypothetical protein [Streptomyces sp. WMMC897]
MSRDAEDAAADVHQTEGTFGDRVLHGNHWTIEPGTAVFGGPSADVS